MAGRRWGGVGDPAEGVGNADELECEATCGGSLPRDGEVALLEEAREVGLACGGPSFRDGGILSRPFSLDE